MTAAVWLNAWGLWVGSCTDCKETIAGNKSMIHIWAEAHDSDNHKGGTP